MTKSEKDLLTEMVKLPKFYYFDVLPALVRCAIFPGGEQVLKEEIKTKISPS